MTEPIDEIVAWMEWRWKHDHSQPMPHYDTRALIASWRKRGEALKSIELMARDYLHVATPQEDIVPALVDQIGRIRICARASINGEPKCAD